MERLEEKKWQAFRLADVFDSITRGKRLKKADHIVGDMPYVSSSALCNGNDGSCGNSENVRTFSDCLTIANSGSVGSCFYHPYTFVASDHVTALHMEDATRECYLALSALLGRIGEKYNFNREINDFRISRERIMLPVTDSGEPDYGYMSEYMLERQKAMLNRYKTCVEKRLAELGEPVDIPALSGKKWRGIPLNEIFTVSAGKRLETRNKIPGSRPFIGATDNGNGITGFVGNTNASRDWNVLGVNYNGAPCIAFYHPYECIFTDDVKRLHLRNHEDGRDVLLFFTEIFAKQRQKYGYGYKFHEHRMLRLKLMLPVTDSGEPDYAYMEQYIRNLMIRKYKKYLAYLERRCGIFTKNDAHA